MEVIMKKITIMLILSVIVLVTMACSFTINLPTIKTGPDQTFEIKEPLPAGNDPLDMALKIGAAKIDFSGGAKGLLDGSIVYNVIDWKPKVTRTNTNLEVTQGNVSNVGGINVGDIKNNWTLKFSDKAPLNLSIDAGAYSGKMDFTGVPLKSLVIHDGASDNTVSFDSANPVEMTKLDYTTGASTVTLQGLANANCDAMSFSGGAGTYTLDFAGTLQRDTNVKIDSGVSTIKVIIPAGMKAVVNVEGGMKDVSTQGTWTVNGSSYTTEGSGPTLTLNVNTNLGTLTLIQE
jgi:hypothetical protein